MENFREKLWEIAEQCFALGEEEADADWDGEAVYEEPLPQDNNPVMSKLKTDYPLYNNWFLQSWIAGYNSRGDQLISDKNDNIKRDLPGNWKEIVKQSFDLGAEAAEGDWDGGSIDEDPTPKDSPVMFRLEQEYPLYYGTLWEQWVNGYNTRAEELLQEEKNLNS